MCLMCLDIWCCCLWTQIWKMANMFLSFSGYPLYSFTLSYCHIIIISRFSLQRVNNVLNSKLDFWHAFDLHHWICHDENQFSLFATHNGNPLSRWEIFTINLLWFRLFSILPNISIYKRVHWMTKQFRLYLSIQTAFGNWASSQTSSILHFNISMVFSMSSHRLSTATQLARCVFSQECTNVYKIFRYWRFCKDLFKMINVFIVNKTVCFTVELILYCSLMTCSTFSQIVDISAMAQWCWILITWGIHNRWYCTRATQFHFKFNQIFIRHMSFFFILW